MPIEKNQSFTFVFPSRKLDGSPNGTTAPTVTISRDGAAGVAVAGAQLVEGMAFTWKITFTADQMNCTSLGIEHTGAGLEIWGTTLCPEAVYTSARGPKLDYLDNSVNLAVGLADDAYNAANAAKASADAAARPGAGMALTVAERNSTADALLDRVDGVETGWSVRKVLRILSAILAGKATGADTSNPAFRNLTDTKTRVTATVDEDGNRESVTCDVS